MMVGVLCLLTTLSACDRSDKPDVAVLTLPVMPAELRRECRDAALRQGTDARLALADTRLALAECRRRHGATVLFYDSVKREFDTPTE